MKRTPLNRKTPLRSVAAKPKAKRTERTAHLGRTKRPRVSKTAAEDRHIARVKAMPCCVTGRRIGSDGLGVVAHHLMVAPGKRTRRDHQWIVPLLDELHRNHSPISVHGLGTEAKFERHHGLMPGYLITFARAAWEASEREEAL
jgi:hypothetical protein